MNVAVPLFGHEDAVAEFLTQLEAQRLHHAWLIAGPAGIGKRTFADAAALHLLARASGQSPGPPRLGVEADHPGAKLFLAGSHPDHFLIEREAWDRSGMPIARDDRSPGDLARNIRISQVRELKESLHLTGALSSVRTVVIDAVDELERSAANALLKSIEEPPPGTTLFLVSRSPDRLLPTIRSRCRLLRLAPLDDAAMSAALHHLLPEASEAERAALAEAGQGAPGAALAFAGLDVGGLDKAMREILHRGDPDNRRRIALAKSLALKAAQPRYEAFLARYPLIVAAEARERKGPALARALAVWERGSEITARARAVSLDPQTTVFELAGMLASLAPGFQGRSSPT